MANVTPNLAAQGAGGTRPGYRPANTQLMHTLELEAGMQEIAEARITSVQRVKCLREITSAYTRCAQRTMQARRGKRLAT